MSKYSLMGLLGLKDGMSPGLRSVLNLTGQVERRVLGLDRALKNLGQSKTTIKVGLSDTASSGLKRLEQQLTRVGRSRITLDKQAAAALASGPSGAGARVIGLDERRRHNEVRRVERLEAQARSRAERESKRAQEQAARQQERFHTKVERESQRAQQRMVQQQQRDRLRFERESATFLKRREREELRIAQQQVRSQARAEQLARRSLDRHRREDARSLQLAERQRQRTIDAWGRGLNRVTGGIWNTTKGLFSGIGSLVMAPVRMLTSLPGMLGMAGGLYGAVSLIRSGLDFSAQMEQNRIAFTTMLGDATKAGQMVNTLFQFSKVTPFEFGDVTQGARMLLAMGFTQDKVIPWLTAIGNATSALGASQEVTQRLIIAIGQIQAKGKLMGEEIRQLAETGIPVVDILSKKLGLAKEEIMKGGDAGISAERALAALYEGLGEKFAGGMAAQSRTWNGLWTTLRDNAMMTLGAMGDGIRGKLQPELMRIVDWFDQNPKQLDMWRQRLTSIGYKGAKYLADVFQSAMAKVDSLFTDPKFQDADFLGKAKIAWSTLIAEPFAEWWGGSGKQRVTETARDIGAFIGGTIAGAVRALFGLEMDGAFADAGVSAGSAFVDGFAQKLGEVDWGAVVGNSFKEHPVLTTATGFGISNFLTGGLLAAATGALLKWGAGKAWAAMAGQGAAGAAASTATGAGAASASVALPVAAVLAGLGAVGWYQNRKFNKTMAPFDEALGGDEGRKAAARRAWWLEMASPFSGTLLPEWIGAGSVAAKEHGGWLEGLRKLLEDAQRNNVTTEPDKQVKVELSVQVTRADVVDDEGLAEKITKRVTIGLQEVLENMA